MAARAIPAGSAPSFPSVTSVIHHRRLEFDSESLGLLALVSVLCVDVYRLVAASLKLSIVCMYGHTFSKSMDQPGKVANPARGQLNRKNEYFPAAFAPENLVSRDGFGSPIPRKPDHLPYSG